MAVDESSRLLPEIPKTGRDNGTFDDGTEKEDDDALPTPTAAAAPAAREARITAAASLPLAFALLLSCSALLLLLHTPIRPATLLLLRRGGGGGGSLAVVAGAGEAKEQRRPPPPPAAGAGAVEKVVYIIRHGEKRRPEDGDYDNDDPAAAASYPYKYACLSSAGYERAEHLAGVFSSSPVPVVALFSFDYDNGDLDCRDGRNGYRTQATLVPLSEALGGMPIHNRTGAKPDLCGLGSIDDAPLLESEAKEEKEAQQQYDDRFCRPPILGKGSVHDFGPCCNVGAAEAIKSELFRAGDGASGSVVVAWEHANIPYLVKALMTVDDDGGGGDGSRNGSGNGNGANLREKEGMPASESLDLDWPDDEFDAIYALEFDPYTRECIGIDTTTFRQGFCGGAAVPARVSTGDKF